MTVTVSTAIVEGTGTLPKDVSLGAYVSLNASTNDGATFEWEYLSKPESSSSLVFSPMSSVTKIGPLDAYGVYQIKLTIDRNSTPKTKILSISVPQASTLPAPDAPSFSQGTGLVRNGSFELPGPLDGWAAYWTTIDDANILDNFAGISRGRCIPTNFNTDGTYAMVLGDDLGSSVPTVSDGDEFSVNQTIDLTNANVLRINLKYINR